MPALNASRRVSWNQRKVLREDRTIKDNLRKVTLPAKSEVKGTLGELVTVFNERLAQLKRHQFNVCHQYRHYRYLRHQINANECLIHVDFSENYIVKFASAISSARYGASQHQITLHTGVYYIRSSGKIHGSAAKAHSFCSLSDSLQHGPGASWAHLGIVTDCIKATYPAVDALHFYSNESTAHYRQNGNFCKFSTVIYEKGIKNATWNFSESEYGKGHLIALVLP